MALDAFDAALDGLINTVEAGGLERLAAAEKINLFTSTGRVESSRCWYGRRLRLTSQQPRRIDVGFDAGGGGVAMERGMGLIGVVSLVDEHSDRPVDRRHVV